LKFKFGFFSIKEGFLMKNTIYWYNSSNNGKFDYMNQYMDLPTLEIDSLQAKERIKDIITRTPLQYNIHLSEKYGAEVYLKREDLQVVRSYKLRGAFNKISSLSTEELSRGVVCDN